MQNKLNISLKPWETPRSAQAILSASINSDLGGEGNPGAHHYVKVSHVTPHHLTMQTSPFTVSPLIALQQDPSAQSPSVGGSGGIARARALPTTARRKRVSGIIHCIEICCTASERPAPLAREDRQQGSVSGGVRRVSQWLVEAAQNTVRSRHRCHHHHHHRLILVILIIQFLVCKITKSLCL